jgi:hypothetical protein
MKGVMRVIAALALISVPVCAEAKAIKQHAGRSHRDEPRSAHRRPHPQAEAWSPRDASKLPFGSASWWEQMRREGRLGGETP